MYFAALPPEINSDRMYAGPGSGPMMAASAAWDGLAADLYSTATCYQSAISGLTGGSWLGPAAASMVAAAAPYTAWITATAAQAEQAASQAKAAAAAYEAAFAMTVPPPVIAANRSLLLALVATNYFGQNVPAIAATQAHYGEMWAQDAAAMYGYAGASAAASTLTPFTPPPQVTTAAGLPEQAAAVAQAASTPAGTGTGTVISAASQLTSAVPNALQELASGAASDSSTSGLAGLMANLFPSSPLQYLSLLAPYTAAIGTTRLATWATTESKLGATGGAAGVSAEGFGTATGEGGQAFALTGELGPTGSTGLSAGGSGALATADMGRAASIGGLTVPQSWAAAAPRVRLVAATSPATSISAAPAVGAGGPDSLLSDMAAASMAGRAMTGTGPRGRTEAAVITIVVRHPSAG